MQENLMTNMGPHNSISPKLNRVPWLEFEVTYLKAGVQNFIRDTTVTTPAVHNNNL